MENARPSSLRGDIWPRCDRPLPRRGEFTGGRRSPQDGFAVLYLFCVAGQYCLILRLLLFREQNFVDDMDVSGTIGAILSQKSKDMFSIRSVALVSEVIEILYEKHGGTEVGEGR